MEQLKGKDSNLADQIQAVVDAGKDIEETEPFLDRKKRRRYRKTVPFTFEEALRVAADALSSYFIEQPLCTNSCLDNMREAAFAPASPNVSVWITSKEPEIAFEPESKGREKTVSIELHTETQISQPNRGTFLLARILPTTIEAQRENLRGLHALFDFRDQ